MVAINLRNKQKRFEIQKDPEKKGYTEKEASNVLKEAKKLEDLEYLKSQNPTGPFSSCDEVTMYLDIEKKKRDTLYKEIRYAGKTSLSLPENASVFRLRREGKYLSSQEYADNLISETNLVPRDH